MRLARVVLMDSAGAYVWEGTLTQFFRDNRSTAEERAEIVKLLRPNEETGRPEPAYLGGGAAAGFSLLLLDPPLPGVEMLRQAQRDLRAVLLEAIKSGDAEEVDVDGEARLWA